MQGIDWKDSQSQRKEEEERRCHDTFLVLQIDQTKTSFNHIVCSVVSIEILTYLKIKAAWCVCLSVCVSHSA